jgi:hypothetical protein
MAMVAEVLRIIGRPANSLGDVYEDWIKEIISLIIRVFRWKMVIIPKEWICI